MVSGREGTGGTADSWYLGLSTDSIQFRFRAIVGTEELSWYCSDPIVSSTWHHVVVAWTGGNTAADIQMYQDGVPCAQQFQTQSGNPGPITVTNLWVGGRWGLHEQDFRGSIDDVRIVSGFLDSTAVADLYQCVQ
jgi:hypothetical protein